MKILLSWIQDFVEIKTSSEKLAERLSVSLAEVERTEKIEDEILFEIENKALTHRPDCFSLIGIAREIAAITDSKFKPPQIGKDVDQNAVSLPLKIEVVNSDLCPRYTAVVITNLKIGPSPTDIQKRLRLSGIRPLGNLVDITNYIMLEWGQPLHAFDYDKLSDEKKIIVRTALPREKINTLDGVERQLDPKMLLIADSVKPIGIAGIMGGSNTEISKTTKTIVLESANFNHFNNRYTSLHLGLRTEASTRFEKGQDPEKTLTALLKAIEMYRHYACGKPASEIFDFYPKPEKQKTIIFCPQKVSEKLGINLVFGKIEKIFNSLNLQITKDAEIWKITIPTYRRDLTIEADLLEEIARIYGYDQIKPSLPPRTLKPPKQNAETIFERKIKNILLRLSLSEIYTYSFVDPKLWKKCLMNSDALLKLKNPLSPELSLVRNNLLPALVDKIALNSKYFAEFSLFEVGKAINHQAKNILPLEVKEVAGGIYSQNELPLLAPWYPPRRIPVSPSGGGGAASSKSFDSSLPRRQAGTGKPVVFSNDYKNSFLKAKGILSALFTELGLREPTYTTGDKPKAPFMTGEWSFIRMRGQEIGVLGNLDKKVAANFCLNGNVSLFKLDLKTLQRLSPGKKPYLPLPKYPFLNYDLSFIIDSEILIDEILVKIKGLNLKTLKSIDVFDVFINPKLGKNKKSVALRFAFGSDKKTLTGKEVEPQIGSIKKILANSFSALIRSR